MINQKETLNLFPQPVFKYKVNNFKEYNEKLSDYIYKLKEEDQSGILRSNKGGWHSKNFDLKNTKSIQHKFLLEITKYVFDGIKTFGWKLDPKRVICTQMWSIINKKGDFNLIHTHANSYLSAAYYVKAPKNCGRFIVENPHSISRHSFPVLERPTQLNAEVVRLEIAEGDLLLFPAYLPHGVEENKSDEDRIVISFNININNFNLS